MQYDIEDMDLVLHKINDFRLDSVRNFQKDVYQIIRTM
jgi:hypothetical protein